MRILADESRAKTRFRSCRTWPCATPVPTPMMVKRFTTSVKEGVPDGIVGIPLIREVPESRRGNAKPSLARAQDHGRRRTGRQQAAKPRVVAKRVIRGVVGQEQPSDESELRGFRQDAQERISIVHSQVRVREVLPPDELALGSLFQRPQRCPGFFLPPETPEHVRAKRERLQR